MKLENGSLEEKENAAVHKACWQKDIITENDKMMWKIYGFYYRSELTKETHWRNFLRNAVFPTSIFCCRFSQGWDSVLPIYLMNQLVTRM